MKHQLKKDDFYSIVVLLPPAGEGSIVYFTEKGDIGDHTTAICGFMCYDNDVLDRFNEQSNSVHNAAANMLIDMYNKADDGVRMGRKNIYSNM